MGWGPRRAGSRELGLRWQSPVSSPVNPRTGCRAHAQTGRGLTSSFRKRALQTGLGYSLSTKHRTIWASLGKLITLSHRMATNLLFTVLVESK